MHTFRIAEFTTVILACTFPTMPRLIQWISGRNDAASNTQPYQRPMKPSNAGESNGSNLKASLPLNELGSATAVLSDGFMQLEEQPTQGMA